MTDCKAHILIEKAGLCARMLALSILFAGSAATVMAAIVLVKTLEAQGVSATDAAFNNAPIFIVFSKVALGAAVLLLLSEAYAYAKNPRPSKLGIARLSASFLCIACTMVFSLGIVPPMETLRPMIRSDENAHRAFHQLHETSRLVFSGTILFALISLVIPAFECPEFSDQKQD